MNDNDNNSNDDTSDNESNLFRESMGDIKRYRHQKADSSKEKPAPIPQKTLDDEKQVLIDMFSDEFSPEEKSAGDSLLFIRPGLQHSVVRKLKRGQFRIEAELDLHGLTINAARLQLSQFLNDCAEQGIRCILIIHGKGKRSGGQGPVLKQKVNHWLPQRDDIMAYCSTIPAHGGTGAIYVLLKRKK